MADGNQNFQVRITTPADLSGADATKSKLAELEAQAQKTNAETGKGFPTPGQVLPPDAVVKGGAIAGAQQQVAIESQLQVIAATRNELLAAQISGNTALVGQLRLELAVRQASLGAMRAQTLTEAELVALTANEEVLLNGIAAAHGRSAVSIGLNRTQAAALAQSLLTGNISAASLGRSLSGLAGPITIAGIAGYTLYNWIAHAADESLEFAQNIDKQVDSLIKATREATNLARAAGSAGDVVNVGEKFLTGLEEANSKLKEIRERELGFWGQIGDSIAKSIRAGPLLGAATSPADEKKQEQIAEQTARITANLNEQNRAIDRANASWATWERVKTEPLAQGIAELTAELDKAREAQAKFDAQRRSSPEAAQRYLEETKYVEILTGRISKLTDEESKRTKLRNETLSSAQAELAILRARASGDEELAKKLERQRDLQKEINDLKAKGLDETKATALAQEKQNLETQIAAQKQEPQRPTPPLTPHFDLSGRDITQTPGNIAAHQPGGGLGDTEPFPTARPPSGLPDRGPAFPEQVTPDPFGGGGGATPSSAPAAMKDAGEQIAAADKEVTDAIKEMGKQVVTSIGQTQAAIVTTMSSFVSALGNLASKVRSLEARISAVETR